MLNLDDEDEAERLKKLSRRFGDSDSDSSDSSSSISSDDSDDGSFTCGMDLMQKSLATDTLDDKDYVQDIGKVKVYNLLSYLRLECQTFVLLSSIHVQDIQYMFIFVGYTKFYLTAANLVTILFIILT